jgi:signal transduction histidine kinase
MRKSPIRILVIEDNTADVRLLREMFGKEPAGSFEMTHVVRMSEGISHLAKGTTDIVLVDMGLPDEHGLATVRRAKAAAPAVPVIVLTGLDDETLASEALQAGAEDYLIKGQIESRALPRALRHAIERRRMQAEADHIQTHQVQVREEFLSHVSHELRSPLTAIYQFVTILIDGLSGELNPKQHQNLAIVLRNVDQLRRMIDDLLEITRLQSGRLVVELQSTSITEAIAYAVSTLGGSAARKGLTLTSDPEIRLPLVFADQARLRQVIVTLLDNAIKFTPSGGSVTVAANWLPEDPDYVHLEVSDSGCGIRPDMIELIFEREFQADGALEGRRGLGLGLYICRELVSRQGGQVWAANQPGRGALFTVTIPVMQQPAQIATLLSKAAFPGAACLALIRVESSFAGGWPSEEARTAWAASSRALIQKCLLRTSDMILPKSDSGGTTELCFVAAFGDDKGVSVLVERIREQFRLLEAAEHRGLSVDVSFQSVRAILTDTALPETSLRTSAAAIAAMMNAESLTRATVHE